MYFPDYFFLIIPFPPCEKSSKRIEKLKEKKFEKMRSLKAKTLCENINKCYLSLCRAGALENSLLYKDAESKRINNYRPISEYDIFCKISQNRLLSPRFISCYFTISGHN